MLNTSILKDLLPPPDKRIPGPEDQYIPAPKVSKDLHKEIDVLYKMYDTLAVGDVAVYAGKIQWTMMLIRVELGLFLKIVDNQLFTLNHNDELLQLHSGQTAGFGPTTLKSRYAVSNLLKHKITQLPKLRIDMMAEPNIIRML